MPIRLPSLDHIRRKDQRLYESLVALHDGIESLIKQAGLGPAGKIATPVIQSIAVTAANGIFSVAITDKSTPHFGINYFVEYADNPSFNNAYTLFLGPSRNVNGWNLGAQTLYFRAFSQYQGSPPSSRVVYGGSAPVAVSGGGSAPPSQPASGGSGAGTGVGGFGGSDRRIL